MVVLRMFVRLRLEAASSLKDKRAVRRSVRDRLRSRFLSVMSAGVKQKTKVSPKDLALRSRVSRGDDELSVFHWLLAVIALLQTLDQTGTVEIGFIATRTRSTSPIDMPPSVPPARFVARVYSVPVRKISSWASDPRRRAVSKPSPTSTPGIATERGWGRPRTKLSGCAPNM